MLVSSILALAVFAAPCLGQWGVGGSNSADIPAAVLDPKTVRSANDTPVPPTYPIGAVKGPFAKTAGTLFEIDGEVTYWAGANAWWLGHLSSNDDIDICMKQIADTQYKVIRVWAFGEVDDSTFPPDNATDPKRIWYQYFNESGAYINYGENGLPRLDYAVSSAERHGVKLVMVFVNEWNEWGGMDLYGSHFGPFLFGQWFVDAAAQAVYRRWVQVLVERYRDSPAIFSWELANEPRCDGCNMNVIEWWAGNMSTFIRSMDPNHMIALGDEGWFNFINGEYTEQPGSTPSQQTAAYAGWNGIDWVSNMNIPGIDYAVFHLYPSTWNYNDTWGICGSSSTTKQAQEHDLGANSRTQAGKPVVLEEYGCNQPFNHTVPEAMWQEAILKSGIAGDQVWQFGPWNTSVDPGNFGDPNSIYYNETEYQLLARDHARYMLNKPVNIIRYRQ